MSQTATLILTHGQIHTLDRANPLAEAVAIADGKIVATGSHDRIMSFAAEGTQIVDLKGHTVIPGLNDSHLHLIRGGLNYNLELRWEGVPSLADALRMLKDQADRTPSPQWVRVVGGWSEFQFAERRMPTLEELNEAAPDTPVFVLHLYDRALLNRAALKAVGYTKETPDPASLWYIPRLSAPHGSTARDRRDGAQTPAYQAPPRSALPGSASAARRTEIRSSRRPPAPTAGTACDPPDPSAFAGHPPARGRPPSGAQGCSSTHRGSGAGENR